VTDVVVHTTSGAVRGLARDGVLHWRGLPYAAPPARFAAPQPPAPWTGVRDATQFGPAAIQAGDPRIALMSGVTDKIGTSEDCLTLNIVAPATTGARPVLVWIHGGAFVMGTAATPLYNGTSFAARHDLVVVTLNYRLGLLGLLPDRTGAGNWALLDQIAALRWVRDNIAAFGGDPASVTVVGESAGAISIATLFAMPAARGLFHRAIVQSGASPLVPAPVPDPAPLLAELGGAGAPVDAVLALQERLIQTRGLGAFAPHVDGVSVPRDPLEAVRAGEVAGIPLLAGSNRDEWRLFELFLGDRAVAPIRDALTARLGPGLPPLLAAYDGDWVALIGDLVFGAPVARLADAQAAHAPVWRYRFDFASTGFGGRLGAAHAIELPLVWNTLDLPTSAALLGDLETARPLGAAMHDAWAAFVRTGDPSTAALPAWPRHDPGRRATMIFDRQSRVVDDPAPGRRSAIEALFGP
jgi:para-nitrobenzyl esterase